jgi:hypothetical protein
VQENRVAPSQNNQYHTQASGATVLIHNDPQGIFQGVSRLMKTDVKARLTKIKKWLVAL